MGERINMKLFFKLFISYTLVLSPMMPHLSWADEDSFSREDMARMMMSPVDSFNESYKKNSLYINGDATSGPRVVSEYRLLGEPKSLKELSKATKAINFIFSFSGEELKTNVEFQKLLETEDGRKKLDKLFRIVRDNLAVVTGNQANRYEDFYKEILRQVNDDRAFKVDENNSVTRRAQTEKRDAEVVRRMLNANDPFMQRYLQLAGEVSKIPMYSYENNSPEKESKRNLEILRRMLDDFTPEDRQRAHERYKEAQRKMSNDEFRRNFDLKNGLSHAKVPTLKANFSIKNQYNSLMGRTVLPVEGPFGNKEYAYYPRSAAGLETEKGSTFMDKLKTGSIQTGHIGLALIVIMFASSEIAMIRSYESNPRYFEENLESIMSWAMPASIGSFFVGGWATDKAISSLDVARRSKANIRSLIEDFKMFVNDPELKSKYLKANMQALKASSFLDSMATKKGLTGGFLFSQFIYRYVDSLESCRKVLGGLDNGEYTPFERNRLRQACDQTVGQIIKEMASSPETWMGLTALLSTHTLLTWGLSRAQMIKYAFSSDGASSRALQGASKFIPYQVKIVSKGFFALPIVSTVVGFAVFSLVFWAVLEGLEWTAGRMTLQMPAAQANKNIRELFRLYESRGWDMQKLCDDRNLLQGGLLDHLKPLMFWKDTLKCGDELVIAFLEQHQKANSAWRSSITDPFYDSINKWSEFTFQATNLYKSAYLLYKDIAEQIKVQRNSGQKVVFKRTKNTQTNAYETLGYFNTHLYNHPLPLFRSEPYFGWDYKLKSDATDIPYPTYDGQTVTWSERFENRVGVEDLTRRKNKFKNEVLVSAVRRLIARLNGLDLNTEYGRQQKEEIEKIIKYLNMKNPDQTGSLPIIARGLYHIAMQVESQKNLQKCKMDGDCFWTEFQKSYLDSELWRTNNNLVDIVLPSLIEILQNYKMSLEVAQIGNSSNLPSVEGLISNYTSKELTDIERIINLLSAERRSKKVDLASVELGVKEIKKKIDEVPKNYNCDTNSIQKTVVIAPEEKICPEDNPEEFLNSVLISGVNVANNFCFWKSIKTNLFDAGHLNFGNVGHTQFLNNQDYWAGYKTTEASPFGVKPLGPGQGYFLRFFDRFKNNGIDPYFYDRTYPSMTDYLLKQMVCGIDVMNDEKMLQKSFADKAFSFFTAGYKETAPDWINKKVSAEFKAPRIALKKGGMNPCFNDESHNRWRSIGPAGAPSFYNYIEHVHDSKFSYGGIVEFLYKEADDSFVQDFDSWWDKYVASEFSEVIERLYFESFNNDLLVNKMSEVMTTDDIDNNCVEHCLDFSFEHKYGLAASIKQEMDTYFTYFFNPLLKGIPVDQSFSEVTDLSEARFKLQTDFAKVRSEIYEILFYISGRNSKLNSTSLKSEYNAIMEDVKAEISIQNPEFNENYDVIKIKALRVLLAKKDYELRVLTRTDDLPFLDRIYSTSIGLLNQMTHLTEIEKSAIKFNIDENFKTLTSEFESLARDGKVILQYKDWPGDQPGACEADEDKPSPTFAMASTLHQLIFESMDELLSLQDQKNLAKKSLP